LQSAARGAREALNVEGRSAAYRKAKAGDPDAAKRVVEIEEKFIVRDVDAILENYGVAPSIQHLTESQGRTVLGFHSIDALRSSLVAAQQARGDR